MVSIRDVAMLMKVAVLLLLMSNNIYTTINLQEKMKAAQHAEKTKLKVVKAVCMKLTILLSSPKENVL